ncbi:MAG: hypothetical protein ACYCX2_02430 [Christensenellales bacterium]
MSDYKNMLILSYFFQYKKNYKLSKLQHFLSLPITELEDRLSDLIAFECLDYNGNELAITHKGVQLLVNSHLEAYPFEQQRDERYY